MFSPIKSKLWPTDHIFVELCSCALTAIHVHTNFDIHTLRKYRTNLFAREKKIITNIHTESGEQRRLPKKWKTQKTCTTHTQTSTNTTEKVRMRIEKPPKPNYLLNCIDALTEHQPANRVLFFVCRVGSKTR